MNMTYFSELTAKLLGGLLGLALIALPIWALADMKKKQQLQKNKKVPDKSSKQVNGKKTAGKLLLRIFLFYMPAVIVVLVIILAIIFSV